MIPNFTFSNPYHVLLSDCIAHDYFFRWCSVQSDGSFSEGYSEGSLTGYLYCHYVLSDFILFSEFIDLMGKLRYLRSLYQKNEQITSTNILQPISHNQT